MPFASSDLTLRLNASSCWNVTPPPMCGYGIYPSLDTSNFKSLPSCAATTVGLSVYGCSLSACLPNRGFELLPSASRAASFTAYWLPNLLTPPPRLWRFPPPESQRSFDSSEWNAPTSESSPKALCLGKTSGQPEQKPQWSKPGSYPVATLVSHSLTQLRLT